jgi:LacI family transcriptional regulator
MKRVTLQDIANQVGLSRGTVSRALRRNPKISAVTRKRIQEACDELGYQPNALLSELAASHWQNKKAAPGTVIGYIDCLRLRPDGLRAAENLTAARRQASVLGYGFEIFCRAEFSSSLKLERVLRNRGITDLILGPVYDKSLTLEFDWSKFIAIQYLPGYFSLPLHSVVYDHFNGVRMVWQKMVEHGYRRIGVCLFNHSPLIMDDIVRLSAIHACQTHLFRHLPILPPFHFSSEPRIEDFVLWIKANEPEALIDFHGTHSQFFRSRFGYNIPYACLHPVGEVSGLIAAGLMSGEEAVNLLHFCRRTYQWGIPENRIDHVLQPKWFEGNTLPKSARNA